MSEQTTDAGHEASARETSTGETSADETVAALTSRRASAGRRAAAIVRMTLLDLAAVAGSVCIVLVVLALAFHITLIMFRTGSMAPQIPIGSVAVVKQIPAAQARVGDVVTVDRPQQLPITHRVVSTAPGPGGATVLELKGDANTAPDPTPYRVTTVRRVLFSVPGLAPVIVWLGNPLVIGGITIAVAALVTWVMWPARERDETDSSAGPGEAEPDRRDDDEATGGPGSRAPMTTLAGLGTSGSRGGGNTDRVAVSDVDERATPSGLGAGGGRHRAAGQDEAPP